MDLKSRVGEKSRKFTDEASAARIRAFRSAVGATDAGEESSIAPPTFITLCRQGEFELFQKLGVPLSRVLHGEQEYVYEAPIEAGDRLASETTLAQAFEKRGSSAPLQFLVLATDIQAERGGKTLRVASARTTVVVRGDLG